MIRVAAAIVLALALALALPAGASAAFLQPVGEFDQPIYVTSPPGNPDRLLVVEREGRIVQVQNGSTSTFADLSGLVGDIGGGSEGGLLSIALAPDFGSSGRLYAFYTGKEEPGEIHVAELRQLGTTAPLSTLRNLLTIPHLGETNHYGGQLQIGPDGYLYISTGDGGGSDDVHENAQNLSRPLGKILRIDPNPSGLLPYTIPPGNPFTAVPLADPTIWAYGLRNPFRFSFDRLSGDLTIGDVGQNAREEVDFAPAPGLGAGANYGWSCREGLEPGPANDPLCAGTTQADFVDPVFDYPHTDPGGGDAFGCAIIGGYVVRDSSLGDLYGRYLYGDLCTGKLRSFSTPSPAATDRTEVLEVDGLNSFGEDSCGRVYAVSGGGKVFRLANPTPAVCPTGSEAPKAPGFIGIRAQSRKVRRGGKALITIWVSPCTGRKGRRVKLLRGRRTIGTRRLDRACTAHFRPRIRRRGNYRGSIAEDANFQAAISRKLKIRVRKAHPARRRARH